MFWEFLFTFLSSWFWVSLSKRGFSSESWKLVFSWHWGIMNKTTIGLNSSSSSNSVFLVFRLICVFVLGSSNIGIAFVFKSSLLSNSVKNNLQGGCFFTIRVFWSSFWWFFSSFWCISGSFGITISFSFIFSLS